MNSLAYLAGLAVLTTGGALFTAWGAPATSELPGPAVSAASAPTEMELVITPEHAALCGHDYSKSSGTVQVFERNDGTTRVLMNVRHLVPDHLYTVWLKVAVPSPLTGGPATPAAAMSDYQEIIDNADTASDAGVNAFYTNAAGNARVLIELDFHLSDGVVPFSALDPTLPDVPIGHSPFTFRLDSHCTDGLQHGLEPGPNEPTFDVSLM